MSDEVEAANEVVDQFRDRIKGNGPYTLNCDPRDLIVAGFDAGRASRDAEVAAAVARVDAAEAVIAAVREALGRVVVAFDAAAPQTVLAERDRKNREEAWAEGVYATPYRSSAVDAETLARNPYTEKEAGSNGNN